MSFIIGWQDGKLRGMCRVPAIYSAREIARLPTEMEGGVGSQNVRAVTSPPSQKCLSSGMGVTPNQKLHRNKYMKGHPVSNQAVAISKRTATFKKIELIIWEFLNIVGNCNPAPFHVE
jgi:hypothetical protein